MAGTIDMQLMRYINLFGKITKVPTTKCFVYNNQIVFVVPKAQVSMAIGKNAENVKKLNDILRRKIKVVAMPIFDSSSVNGGGGEIGKFIEAVVSPVEFNRVELKENTLVVNAGRQSKATLIGRGRQREKELSDVLRNFFGISKLRIV
ncbi:KH domain-containing protein [Candidatus Pacearchaeota archaeon]|nr:KH domain-containing protein [Candidatus Pacearchaeota archaeon]